MDIPAKGHKVLAFIRVSDSSQAKDDRFGIPAQLEEIRKLCIKHGYAFPGDGDLYKFTGLSGAEVTNSPEVRAMLERLYEPDVDGIVFPYVDRLIRLKFLDQFSITEPFRKARKKMICDIGAIDPRDQGDSMKLSMFVMAAGITRSRIVEGTHRGREQSRMIANRKTDTLPVGLKFISDNPQDPRCKTGSFAYDFENHGAYLSNVKDAFRRIVEGGTLGGLVSQLGFASRTVLHNILSNPWWIGYKHTMKQRIYKNDKGEELDERTREDGSKIWGTRKLRDNPILVKTNLAETPLVTREVFDAVQNILQEHRKEWSKASDHTHKFLGLGITYCGECGSKMYTKESKGYLYYRCSKLCGLKWLKQPDVDKEIRAFVLTLQNPKRWTALMGHNTPDVDTTAIQKELDKAANILTKKARLIGTFAIEAVEQANNREIEKYNAQIVRLQKQLKAAPKPAINPEQRSKQLANFLKLSTSEQQQKVQSVFSKVVLGTSRDTDADEETPVIHGVKLRH